MPLDLGTNVVIEGRTGHVDDGENSAPASVIPPRAYPPQSVNRTDVPRDEATPSGTELHLARHIGRPRRGNLTITVGPRSRLIPLQTWEGLVESVNQKRKSFTARLYDLTRTDSQDVEIAEFNLDEVEPDGRELILRGAVFRWIVGYRDSVFGKRERVSSIVFRRLPAWTAEDKRKSRERGEQLANALRGK